MRKAITLVAVLLIGCGTVTSESIYEGIRTHNKLKNVGIEAEVVAPNYQHYEKERDSLKK